MIRNAWEKGQVSVTVAIIGGVVTVVTALGGSFMTSATQVAVIEEREQNHYEEVQRQLSEINSKVDQLLTVQQKRAAEKSLE